MRGAGRKAKGQRPEDRRRALQPFGKSLLVIGGARSGKSRHAQRMAESVAGKLIYVATGQAFDAEMADRITRHRADRDVRWRTVEAPLRLAEAIAAADGADAVLLVDCLTLWTSNLMLGDEDSVPALDALIVSIGQVRGRLILVSNEVGMGIVPENALARRFRDLAGTINQRVAAAVETVDLAVAGLTMRFKG